MLVQTDRFGTSVAQSLRVFSDDLRIKRRQRAEEMSAKTTVKMVPPLIFFIFPALDGGDFGPSCDHADAAVDAGLAAVIAAPSRPHRRREAEQLKRRSAMDNVTLIRVVAGALAVLVLFIIIWRRKRKSIE